MVKVKDVKASYESYNYSTSGRWTVVDMETSQISGIDDTFRETSGDMAAGSKLTIHENIMLQVSSMLRLSLIWMLTVRMHQ